MKIDFSKDEIRNLINLLKGQAAVHAAKYETSKQIEIEILIRKLEK